MIVRQEVGPGWGQIQARAAKAALRRGLNRSTRTVRTRAGREVAQRMGLKVRDVRESTDVRLARGNQLETRIEARGRPLNLIRFGARQTKRGVRAKPWNQSRLFPGLWIGNDGRTVFVRSRKQGRAVRSAFGPGLGNEMTELVRSRRFRELYAERFLLEFREAYRFQLDRTRTPGG